MSGSPFDTLQWYQLMTSFVIPQHIFMLLLYYSILDNLKLKSNWLLTGVAARNSLAFLCLYIIVVINLVNVSFLLLFLNFICDCNCVQLGKPNSLSKHPDCVPQSFPRSTGARKVVVLTIEVCFTVAWKGQQFSKKLRRKRF